MECSCLSKFCFFVLTLAYANSTHCSKLFCIMYTSYIKSEKPYFSNTLKFFEFLSEKAQILQIKYLKYKYPFVRFYVFGIFTLLSSLLSFGSTKKVDVLLHLLFCYRLFTCSWRCTSNPFLTLVIHLIKLFFTHGCTYIIIKRIFTLIIFHVVIYKTAQI